MALLFQNKEFLDVLGPKGHNNHNVVPSIGTILNAIPDRLSSSAYLVAGIPSEAAESPVSNSLQMTDSTEQYSNWPSLHF
ncbi:hypothetical protein ETB97_009818 [Aspergillus alliaceus]|uniref:Uncharacterized protein n=1 Tax=Petromyces alliaceus TaxID=209559 RepID=A0A8H6A9H7_PETAA|nr:hypothetical protein ETB97_009818 [Aspergillus burnettii]